VDEDQSRPLSLESSDDLGAISGDSPLDVLASHGGTLATYLLRRVRASTAR
jgi:hypothetical protein